MTKDSDVTGYKLEERKQEKKKSGKEHENEKIWGVFI